MGVIILAVIVGLGIGYFATQNTNQISLYFGPYAVSNTPLYLVVISALLMGLLLAWIFSLVNSFSSKITLHGKENKIKEDEKTIAELTKEIHQLELDNTRLKEKSGEGKNDDKSL
ncbi:DUF1049 domain-containing protein [Candidatus Daviesbacteria bacterium]|nr:DUF1049 domain-containing protein [Candidatus Daviesbacteria bacterium]